MANSEKYRDIFQKVDTDQNNLICLRELDAFLRKKRNNQNLPKDMILYVHRMADKDGDKSLTYDEFVYLLEHPDLKHLFGRVVNKYVHFLVPQRQKVEKSATLGEQEMPILREEIVERTFTIRGRSALGTETRKSRSVKVVVQEEDEEEDLSYIGEFSCCPPPIAMFLISILELAFFLTDELTQKDSTLSGSGVTATVFIYDPSRRYQAWRFLTYMFVHIGYLHIVVNLAFQLLLGIPLEMVHKWWRVLLVYFLGIIAGSLATSLIDPWVRLAGASGGVYALMTAHIATIIMNWTEMTFPAIQLFIFGIIGSCDIGSAIYDRYFLNINEQIGFAAHFGGAVAGLLVGIYTLRNLNVKKIEKYVAFAAVVIYVALMLIAIFINICFPSRYPARDSYK